jgi:hypothetical protein
MVESCRRLLLGGFSSLCRDVEISLTSNRQRRKDKMQNLLWFSGANLGNGPMSAEQQLPQRAGLGGTQTWARLLMKNSK